MRQTICLLAALMLPAAALAADAKAPAPKPPDAKPAPEKKDAKEPASKGGSWIEKAKKGQDIYATFETSMGNIVVKLFPKDAPKTVENFVGLASGEKEWKDPRNGEMSRKPLYDGTVFHRVIPDFMIQGGDPLGQGVGGPGYQFEDEFQSGKVFDKPCILAMANAGPNTNGSQFFITEVPTPHLNNLHTIFGEVVKGCDLVPKITRARGEKVQLKKIGLSDKAPK